MISYTNAQMDEAILLYRRMTSEQFQRALIESPEFKEKIEAAYQRGVLDPSKNFMHFDRDGWYPTQYNVRVPPARPNDGRRPWIKPIPGAALF